MENPTLNIGIKRFFNESFIFCNQKIYPFWYKYPTVLDTIWENIVPKSLITQFKSGEFLNHRIGATATLFSLETIASFNVYVEAHLLRNNSFIPFNSSTLLLLVLKLLKATHLQILLPCVKRRTIIQKYKWKLIFNFSENGCLIKKTFSEY